MDTDKLRQQYQQLIIDQDPNMLITLGAGLGLQLQTFDQQARHFLNKVQREVRGRDWAKCPATSFIKAVGFFEHVQTNLHLHIAAHVPGDLRIKILNAGETWKGIRIAGDYHSDLIHNVADYAQYITKEYYRPVTRDNVFIYCKA